MDVIKALVADAHGLFRTGVVSLIHQQVDFEVIGEAQDGVQAVETATTLKPDLVLMDIHLPKMGGLEAARQIKEAVPHVTLVLLTGAEMDAELWEAIRVGADGYLSKQIDPQGFCRALRGVMRGEAAISQGTCTKLFVEFVRLHRDGAGIPCPHRVLSSREQEMLQCLTTGAGNKEIAATLGISEHTVKSHLKRILLKLQLENRVQATAYALSFRCYRYASVEQNQNCSLAHEQYAVLSRGEARDFPAGDFSATVP